MAAHEIKINRDKLFEATAILLAFKELFEELDEGFDIVDGWPLTMVASDLTDDLCGGLAALDDDAFERHPVHVDVHARARELTAAMVTSMEERAGDAVPISFAGDPFTRKGLRKLARRFAVDAMLTRNLGVIHPPRAQVEAALAGDDTLDDAAEVSPSPDTSPVPIGSFDERIALLEEHVVIEKPSAEDFLARAEAALARGDRREAAHCLNMAKIRRSLERLEGQLEAYDDLEEEDDDV